MTLARWSRGLGIGLLIALGGCTPRQRIDIRDGPLLFPTARVSVALGGNGSPQGQRADEPAPPPENRAGLGLEGSFTGLDASDDGYDYRVLEAGLAMRSTFRAGEVVNARVLYGAGWHSLRVGDWEDDGYGPLFGVGLGWEVSRRVEPYFRATVLWTFDAQSSQLEAGVAFRFTDHLRALVGYRYWEFDYLDLAGGPDVELKAHGPVVGLALDF